MLNGTQLSLTNSGRWMVLFATCALVTMSLSACQSEESLLQPSTDVLELDPATATMVEGDTLRINAFTKNGGSAPTALDPSSQVTWKSSAPEFAVVEDGLIRSLGAGEVRITALSAAGAEASASITVRRKDSPPATHGMLPAFPGAEGWGATALNECRRLPLAVHQVTNTNRDGPGSFRDIMENRLSAEAFDVVVFRTGGLINLNSATGGVFVPRRTHCVYVAGQTAPGGGISLVGHGVEFRDANDVVLRHIRHRGQNPGTALLHRGGFRVIYADITGSWSVGRFIIRFSGGENFPMGDATVQNTLLYEPDAGHATHLGLNGNNEVDPSMHRVSAHRNAMLGPGRRMPLCQGYGISVVNNVMYNWQMRATEANNTGVCDFVANYHKPGPTTMAASQRFNQRPFVIWNTCSKGVDCTKSYYIADNRSNMNAWVATSGAHPWEGPDREAACAQATDDEWCEQHDDPVDPAMRRFAPLPAATPFPVNQLPITDALVEEIVSSAGHSRRLTCDGSWTAVRDEVDAQRVEWFRSGSGFDSNVHAADMKIPVPTAGTPCRDTDGDGLPDEWEERFFGCATCADPTAVGRVGYLVIEHYVNGTNPR